MHFQLRLATLTSQVATIVDDIAKLAIEQTFLRGLDSLLCLDFVCSLNDSDLDWIAGETDAISFDRNHFEQKIKVLEGGIDELKARSHYFVLIARKHVFRPHYFSKSLKAKI